MKPSMGLPKEDTACLLLHHDPLNREPVVGGSEGFVKLASPDQGTEGFRDNKAKIIPRASAEKVGTESQFVRSFVAVLWCMRLFCLLWLSSPTVFPPILLQMVEIRGFEPLTCSLRTNRSTN